MAGYDFDLFTIGAGSGGVRAARMAATHGARVAICDQDVLGGTCVNRGCIPKKLYVYASHFGEDFEDAVAYGWVPVAPVFDWRTLVEAKVAEIARLNGIYESLLSNAGVKIVRGRAVLADGHTVRVGDAEYTAEHVLIATGGGPTMPGIPGIEHAISSDQAFDLAGFPRRVAIVGGGYISVEFAGIFNGLGAEVVQCYRGEQILRGFDDDVRHTVAAEIVKKGVDLRLGTNIVAIEKAGPAIHATTTHDEVLEVDQVMFATGRAPNTRGLGLPEVGVELARNGAVVVDALSASTVQGIHAIGDVTDRINLTPVAIHEAMCLADTLFGTNPRRPDHRDVASAVFSQPPVGTVGLTEAEAHAAYGAIDIYRSRFRPLKHTLTGRDESTMMKLIVDRASDRVVGCHMVGADAGEIIQGIAIAVKCQATKAQFDATIAIHPTAAEEFVTMREPVPEPVAEAAE